MKNIAIDEQTHRRLVDDAKRHNSAKLYAMVAAYQRGWPLLSAEQQHQAMTGGSPSPSNLPEASDVDEEITRLFRDAADVHHVFHQAARDGRISHEEAALVIGALRKLSGHAEHIAGATREMRKAS